MTPSTRHGSTETLARFGSPVALAWVRRCSLSSLREELEEHTKHSNGALIYYFCRHDDERRNNETAILRGLLLQLVRITSAATFEQHVWPKFATAESTNYTFSTLSTMRRMLSDVVAAQDFERIYCVLDGLDECNKESSKHVVERLHAFSNKVTRFASPFRLAIVSREMPPFSGFNTIPLDIHDSHIRQDIELFISSNIEKALSHKTGFGVYYLQQVSERLFDGSEGSFLWISFVAKDLSEYETQREVTKALD
ncbi:uncharacterized protein PG986_010118 [Apiospora aurea]|uniref:Nephrocystin 3-like N-terminal domain-containing protein n=1 Tax=Apiospora aurea TaxID=335848 RepID=A0ABR1Q9K4_9PEZI